MSCVLCFLLSWCLCVWGGNFILFFFLFLLTSLDPRRRSEPVHFLRRFYEEDLFSRLFFFIPTKYRLLEAPQTHHHQRISISIHINNTIMMLRTLTFTAALILSLASAERFNEIKVNVYWHTRELNWTELNWTEHDWLVTPPITSPRCAMQHHRNPIHACMHAFIHI